MHGEPIQNSDSWYLSVIEFLKSKNCGKINCRSRLEPRYSVCDEIECIVSENLQKNNIKLNEKR
jgi:hypothetical protein